MLSLSKRQWQIAGLLCLGHSEKKISEKLYISEATTHTHKKNIFRIAKVNNVVDLTRKVASELTGMDVSKLIRENIIEPNAYRVVMMIIFLSLQFTAMNAGLDYRRVRTSVKTVSTRVARARRNEV